MTQDMLKPFLHYPVIVAIPELREVAGVLMGADVSLHGGFGNLLLGTVGGQILIVKQWTVLKTGRSHS